MTLTQYQQLARPLSQSPERVSVDKFYSNSTSLPISNWRAATVAAAVVVLAPSLAFTNIFPQQQATTVDKYYQVTQTPTWTVKNQTWITGDYAFVLDNSQRPEVAKITSGESITLAYPRTVLYQSLTYPIAGFSPAERATPDKWQPETNKPVFDHKRAQYLYPAQVQNILPIEETSDVQIAGIRQTDVPYFGVKHTEYLFPSTAPQNVLPNEEGTDVQLAGIRQTNVPLFGTIHTEYLFPNQGWQNILPIEETADIQLAGIRQTNVPLFDIKHTEYLFPSCPTQNVFPITAAEVITVDKWYKLPNQPLFDIQRTQYLFQGFTIDSLPRTETPKIASGSNNVVLTFPRVTLYQAHTYPVAGFSPAERATPDKWQPETNRPVFDHKRLQYLSPTFIESVFPLPNAETVTVDKWYVLPNQPLFAYIHQEYITRTITPLVFHRYKRRTQPTTSYSRRTQPSTSFTQRSKPTTSFTARTKPSTSTTRRSQPNTPYTGRTKPYNDGNFLA